MPRPLWRPRVAARCNRTGSAWPGLAARGRGARGLIVVAVRGVPALVPSRGTRLEVEAYQVGEAQPGRLQVAVEHAEHQVLSALQAAGPAEGPAAQFIGAPLPARVGKLVHERPPRLVRLNKLEVVEPAPLPALKADADQCLKLRVGELARLGEQREQHGPLPGGQLLVMHSRTTPNVARETRK